MKLLFFVFLPFIVSAGINNLIVYTYYKDSNESVKLTQWNQGDNNTIDIWNNITQLDEYTIEVIYDGDHNLITSMQFWVDYSLIHTEFSYRWFLLNCWASPECSQCVDDCYIFYPGMHDLEVIIYENITGTVIPDTYNFQLKVWGKYDCHTTKCSSWDGYFQDGQYCYISSCTEELDQLWTIIYIGSSVFGIILLVGGGVCLYKKRRNKNPDWDTIVRKSQSNNPQNSKVYKSEIEMAEATQTL